MRVPILKRFKLKDIHAMIKNGDMTENHFKTWIYTYRTKHWLLGCRDGEDRIRRKYEERAQKIAALNKAKGEKNDTVD